MLGLGLGHEPTGLGLKLTRLGLGLGLSGLNYINGNHKHMQLCNGHIPAIPVICRIARFRN